MIASRVWPAQEYTRVTFETARPVRHQFFEIPDPPRLVLDLEGVDLDAELRSIVSKVREDDPYITQVRVAMNRPNVARVVFDLKPLLWQEIALKEDDLRAFCKTHDWSQYTGKFVSVHCSADAIIPTWAFMLVATHLQPHAAFVTQGDADQLERAVFTRFVQQLDVEPYRNARVVVKGCSKLPVPLNAYVELSTKLLPVVKSLMFGEPCSTVPLYKAPK